MADWYPPEPPRSHRASSGARHTLTRLAAPLTAVLVVVVVIVLLVWINGRGNGNGSNATVAPPATPLASPVHTSAPVSSPTPRPTHAHHTPTPHPTHHHATPSSSPSVAATDTAFAPVSVLNNSRIHGLAHHVAAEVEGRGWTISTVGNLQGRVAETTVFYPPSGFDAAEHLAHEFGQIQRLEPQSEGGLHSTDLVLVVTRFWTG
jgi:cytoskeletal protein RodZ